MSNKSARCLRCQKKLDPFDVTEDSNGLCLECGVALRDATMARESAKSAPRNLISAGVKNTLTGIFLLGLLIWTIKSIPGLGAAFAPLKPISSGVIPTDDETNACVMHLWEAARALQENESLENLPHCPLASGPYAIDETGGRRMVHCPNPLDHGVSDLYVSEGNPIPRTTK